MIVEIEPLGADVEIASTEADLTALSQELVPTGPVGPAGEGADVSGISPITVNSSDEIGLDETALVPGSDTEILFNDSGLLGADSGLTYNGKTLGVQAEDGQTDPLLSLQDANQTPLFEVGSDGSITSSIQPAVLQLTSDNTTHDLNSNSWARVPWTIIKETDTLYDYDLTADNTAFTVTQGGLYRLKVRLTYNAIGRRDSPAVRFTVNGVQIDGDGRSGYVRNGSGHDTGTTYLETTTRLSAGDTVGVVSKQTASSGTDTMIPNQSEFRIENMSVITRDAGDASSLQGYSAGDFFLKNVEDLSGAGFPYFDGTDLALSSTLGVYNEYPEIVESGSGDPPTLYIDGVAGSREEGKIKFREKNPDGTYRSGAEIKQTRVGLEISPRYFKTIKLDGFRSTVEVSTNSVDINAQDSVNFLHKDGGVGFFNENGLTVDGYTSSSVTVNARSGQTDPLLSLQDENANPLFTDQVSGDRKYHTAGSGIVLTSPDGNTTKRVYLDNSGNLQTETP